MNTFDFIKNPQALAVTIRGKSYPVLKAGQGRPCLLICLGTPTFRTLSAEFARHFTVYSSDVYWVEKDALENPDAVTLDTIVDDIKALADALKLEHYVLFGHSAYGIIALEFAKKYPEAAAGIIMVGTPVNSNEDVARQNEQIFQTMADAARKAMDADRRAQFAAMDLSSLSSEEQWLKSYVYRDAPRYWYQADFDCSELWRGLVLSRLLGRLFSEILPATNVQSGLAAVTTPVYLAAGMYDYDCCPWVWKTLPHLPRHFQMTVFEKSGHWPHYEEAALFDRSVVDWLQTIKE